MWGDRQMEGVGLDAGMEGGAIRVIVFQPRSS